MHLNEFAPTSAPLDMTRTEEFASLLASATDLSIPHSPDVRYLSRNVVVQHRRLHFLEWGRPDAPPLVLLHGGNQSAHSWDLVSLHLADRFRVLALDQRGHGDSEWARDGDYSNLAMARDAHAFSAELELEKPIVMGHSMGGRNALRLVLDHPEAVRALVIVDIGPEISLEGAQAIRSFVSKNREFDDLDEFVRNVQRYDPFRSKEHIARTVRYNLLRRVDGKYVSKCDQAHRIAAVAADRPIALTDVKAIEQPTLIVRGEQSNVLTADAASRFAEALTKGRLVTVPACGHNVHSQNTPGFLEVVRAFLAEL